MGRWWWYFIAAIIAILVMMLMLGTCESVREALEAKGGQ